jgi:hypothetical protein
VEVSASAVSPVSSPAPALPALAVSELKAAEATVPSDPRGTPVVVLGPLGPVTMIMTAEGTLLPLQAQHQSAMESLTVPASAVAAVASASAAAGLVSPRPKALAGLPTSPEASRGSYGLTAGLTPARALGAALGNEEEAVKAAAAPAPAPAPALLEQPSADSAPLRKESALGQAQARIAKTMHAGEESAATAHNEHAGKARAVAPTPDEGEAAVAAVHQKGGKRAPAGGELGAFMFVKNSRHDPSKPSPDNPRYWVGRVSEMMRGGRVKLHWHRETARGSGVYAPTNNYFPERPVLLRAMKAAAYDSAARAWVVAPRVETMESEAGVEAATSAPFAEAQAKEAEEAAAKAAEGGLSGSEPQDGIAFGSFVFLRNVRFRPHVAPETVDSPRYWMARVTPITVMDSPETMDTATGRAASAGAGSKGALASQVLCTPDGRLRLQWFRETAVGSGLYTASNHIFFERRSLCRSCSSGLAFQSVLNAWKRVGEAPVFPGDEEEITRQAHLPAGLEQAGGGIPVEQLVPGKAIEAEVPAVPVTPGTFAFVANSKWAAGKPDNPTAPRFYVARVLGVIPATPAAAARVKVQWHCETAVGSCLYRQTAKSFFESPSSLRPLPDMVFDTSLSAWRLTGPFNTRGRYEAPEAGGVTPAGAGAAPSARASDAPVEVQGVGTRQRAAAAPAHAPAPVGAPFRSVLTSGGMLGAGAAKGGGPSGSPYFAVKCAVADASGLLKGSSTVYIIGKGRGLTAVCSDAVAVSGGVADLRNVLLEWRLPPSPAALPSTVELEIWDSQGGRPTPDAGISDGSLHVFLGRAEVGVGNAARVPSGSAPSCTAPGPAVARGATLWGPADVSAHAALGLDRVALGGRTGYADVVAGSLGFKLWVSTPDR